MMLAQGQYVDAPSRSVLDVAIGVLVGCRRCTRAQAFDEMARAVKDTGVGLAQLSAGLVDLASRGANAIPELRTEVVERWGDLFRD